MATPLLLLDVRESSIAVGATADIVLRGPLSLITNAEDEMTTAMKNRDAAKEVLSSIADSHASFGDYLVDQDTVLYRIFDFRGNWESGVGTYNEGANSLTRTTVISSSNGDMAVDFPAGPKIVVSRLDAKIVNQLLDLAPYPFW